MSSPVRPGTEPLVGAVSEPLSGALGLLAVGNAHRPGRAGKKAQDGLGVVGLPDVHALTLWNRCARSARLARYRRRAKLTEVIKMARALGYEPNDLIKGLGGTLRLDETRRLTTRVTQFHLHEVETSSPGTL